jgi:hypothetical protein
MELSWDINPRTYKIAGVGAEGRGTAFAGLLDNQRYQVDLWAFENAQR